MYWVQCTLEKGLCSSTDCPVVAVFSVFCSTGLADLKLMTISFDYSSAKVPSVKDDASEPTKSMMTFSRFLFTNQMAIESK